MGNGIESNKYFDIVEKKILSFNLSGQGDYNNIVETIRSFAFSGKITEEESEKLLLMLPNISGSADSNFTGLNTENTINSSFCDDDESIDEIPDEEIFEEDENTKNSFEIDFDGDDVFDDDLNDDLNDDDIFSDEIKEQNSSFDLDDNDDEILSYKDEEEDYYTNEETKDSGFDIDLDDDCDTYDNSDIIFEETEKEKTNPFDLF